MGFVIIWLTQAVASPALHGQLFHVRNRRGSPLLKAVALHFRFLLFAALLIVSLRKPHFEYALVCVLGKQARTPLVTVSVVSVSVSLVSRLLNWRAILH